MSLQKSRHVILTRYNLGLYDREDADRWMKHRYAMFEKTRASVLDQEGDFEWILSVDERTPDRWVNELLSDSRMTASVEHPNKFRSEGWTITTRLDNDDIYMPGAVKAIQSRFATKELVIDLRYWGFFDGKLYESDRPQPNSPFLSLVENGAKKTCYARPHSKMICDYESIFASREHFALMVVHDRNLGNKIVGKEFDFKSLPKKTRDYIKRL